MVDSDDLVQDTLAEMWKEAAAGRIWEREEELVGFVIRVTQHITHRANRHAECAKRQGDLLAVPLDPDEQNGPASTEADPYLAALADDEWRHLLEIAGETMRPLLELRRIGWSFQANADHVGSHERTVRKMVELLFRRLPAPA
jgi:DNA-directed RNA polymerase specialized sigma24 family protein